MAESVRGDYDGFGGGSEAFLVPTASLESYGLDLSWGWCGCQPPGASKVVYVLLVGNDEAMRVLMGLRERRGDFLCPRASFR